MKNATITLLASLSLAGFSFAGPSGKAPMGKIPVVPPAPSCNCFEAGGQFSLYAAGLFGADDSETTDSMGTGIAVDYFFTSMLGAEVDATWIFADSTIHNFTGSLVFRYPIVSACLAPYVFAGGGYHTNGVNQAIWHAGAGLDVRLANCFGIFADGRYTWAEETENYVIVRAGIRVNF